MENHETLIYKLVVEKCASRIQNRVTIKSKSGYHLELLTPETLNVVRMYHLYKTLK